MKWPCALHIVLGILIGLSCACKKDLSELRPLIFGHAGMALSEERAIYPPNSEKSISYALDVLNADGVEVDVQMTADSVLVLFHDAILMADDFKNLETDQCIAEMTWSQIENLNNNHNRPIIKLSSILKTVIKKGKFIMLDTKHYNQCADEIMNFEVFNRTLEAELLGCSDFEKELIIVNSRNINLLEALQNPSLIKSFESEKIDLAIDYYKGGLIDLLTTKLEKLTQDESEMLKSANLDYYIYNVKTRKEIKTAAKFNANGIITDNIAATKAYFN